MPGHYDLDGLPTVTEVLLPVSGAGRRARDVVTKACLIWNITELATGANQVVTELVVNAAVHAATLIELTVLRRPHDLMILVRDGSPAPPVLVTARVRPVAEVPDGGDMGLRIVHALAGQWGSWPEKDGKTVWAVLLLDTPR